MKREDIITFINEHAHRWLPEESTAEFMIDILGKMIIEHENVIEGYTNHLTKGDK